MLIYRIIKKLSLKIKILSISILALLIFFWFSVSFPLFNVSYSTVIYDKENNLLGAHIASDGQWRFPQSDSVPQKFVTCLLNFEDEHYYKHPGVNPLALIRAAYQNITEREVVSGGSTITMQVIRLATQHKRTILNKTLEIFQAIRLESELTKKEILKHYATHAPFGGNVVGIDAASWRYFKRKSHMLSWAENAMLAVLPNAPGLIHTRKNRDKLKAKRDRLLKKLYEKNIIDKTTYVLSVDEPIPSHPHALPQLAPHLLDYCRKQKEGKIYQLCIDKTLQKRVNKTIKYHYNKLKLNEIHNAGAIVLKVKTGEVIAYCGNTPAEENTYHENHVDVIQAARSTGSILKPLLYAAKLQDGTLLPKMLIDDVPTYYKNFAPKNYNRSYAGAVPADEALSRSLNIPAVKMLKEYDIGRFCSILQKAGLSTIKNDPDYYGLSLILGGAEASLFELAGVYAAMARTVKTYTEESSVYNTNEFVKPKFFKNEKPSFGIQTFVYPVFGAGAIYHTFNALTNVSRPEEEAGWESFTSSRKIAWKTGTSFGFRDAWSIGITPEYVVGVWVGNATGEGRPGIVGGVAAGPIMFDIFNALPKTTWFQVPYDDMKKEAVCRVSGYKANKYCPVDTLNIQTQGVKSKLCPYHKLIHLNSDKTHRVNSNCYPTSKMQHQSWFILPPIMEWYYQRNHPLYKKIPPFLKNCGKVNQQVMQFVYPQNNSSIYLPKGLDGELQNVVLKVVHKKNTATIYWHLDDDFLGETKFVHQMAIQPTAGWHMINLVDEDGNTIKKRIRCVGRGDE